MKNEVSKKQNEVKKQTAVSEAKQTAVKNEVKQTEAKAEVKKETIANRREALCSQIVLKDSIQFENDKTARNSVNCAMITLDSAIVLTAVSKDSSTASRLVECYLHRNKVDLLFSKRVFERLTTATDSDSKAVKSIRETLINRFNAMNERDRLYKSKYRLFVENEAFLTLINDIVKIA